MHSRAASLLLVLAFLGAGAEAHAQAGPYTVVVSEETFVPLGGDATAIVPNLGDAGSAHVALPFGVYLYGRQFRELWINANGLLSVTPIGVGYNVPPASLPDPTAPLGMIAPLWGDWCAGAAPGPCVMPAPSPADGVYTEIDATPGAGKITVEWRALRAFSDAAQGSASRLNFQAVLHEGTGGAIELRYGDLIPGTAPGGASSVLSARIGIESADGMRGMWLGPCIGAAPCDATDLMALGQHTIRISADAGANVAVAGVAAPAHGYPGVPLPISAELVSAHDAPLGPFQVAALLLPSSATSSAGGVLVAESGPITLGPYEARTIQLSAAIPDGTTPGRYRIGVLADPERVLPETDRSQSFRASVGLVRIAGRAPDFAMIRVAPLEPVVHAGQTLDVGWVFANAGNLAGHASLELVLSRNALVSTSEPELGASIEVDTEPQQTYTGTLSAPLPSGLPSGEYWVGAILDPAGTVAELDTTNNTALAAAPIRVAGGDVRILTADLPPATETVAYDVVLDAIGGPGPGPITFRLADGVLPRGIEFDAARAELYGIPLAAGSFPLSFEAKSGTVADQRTLMLVVSVPSAPLQIVAGAGALPAATAGTPYVEPIRAVGGTPPYAVRIVEGALPDGLLLGTDGAIVGTPVRSATASFAVAVRDSASQTATASLFLIVAPAGNLSAVPGVLAPAVVGRPYAAALYAGGGTPPLRWSAMTSTAIPPGLALSASGLLSGTPTREGQFTFRVQVTDAAARADGARVTVLVTGPGSLAFSTADFPAAQLRMPYSASIQAQGGTPPYTFSIVEGAAALPPGLSRSAGNAALVVAGEATENGIWPFTVQLADSAGASVERPYAIVVGTPGGEAPVAPGGCGCQSADPGASRAGAALVALFALLSRGALLFGRRRRSRT
jgi:hypothetical protein